MRIHTKLTIHTPSVEAGIKILKKRYKIVKLTQGSLIGDKLTVIVHMDVDDELVNIVKELKGKYKIPFNQSCADKLPNWRKFYRAKYHNPMPKEVVLMITQNFEVSNLTFEPTPEKVKN